MHYRILIIGLFLVLSIGTSFAQQNDKTETTTGQQVTGNEGTHPQNEQLDTTSTTTTATPDENPALSNNLQDFEIRRGDMNDLERSLQVSFPNWLRSLQGMEEHATELTEDEQQAQQAPALPVAPAPADNTPSSPTRQEAPAQRPHIREQQRPAVGQITADPTTDEQEEQQLSPAGAQAAVPPTNAQQVENDPNVNIRQAQVSSTNALPEATSTSPLQTTPTPLPTTLPPHATMMTSTLVSTITHTTTQTPLPRPSGANTLFNANNIVGTTIMLLVVILII